MRNVSRPGAGLKAPAAVDTDSLVLATKSSRSGHCRRRRRASADHRGNVSSQLRHDIGILPSRGACALVVVVPVGAECSANRTWRRSDPATSVFVTLTVAPGAGGNRCCQGRRRRPSEVRSRAGPGVAVGRIMTECGSPPRSSPRWLDIVKSGPLGGHLSRSSGAWGCRSESLPPKEDRAMADRPCRRRSRTSCRCRSCGEVRLAPQPVAVPAAANSHPTVRAVVGRSTRVRRRRRRRGQRQSRRTSANTGCPSESQCRDREAVKTVAIVATPAEHGGVWNPLKQPQIGRWGEGEAAILSSGAMPSPK